AFELLTPALILPNHLLFVKLTTRLTRWHPDCSENFTTGAKQHTKDISAKLKGETNYDGQAPFLRHHCCARVRMCSDPLRDHPHHSSHDVSPLGYPGSLALARCDEAVVTPELQDHHVWERW